ncbi:NADPH-dependent F420 reductase [Streptomyces sp. NBC_01304]|uniref:NADPH-dependent F420 reductase n=1 Tax=Streptomyces sp. NBC_01304 TaxID=2903818 RepID=UPI002E15A080|nr:NAD(P)-binding domain-containing protein [Streptomyces sp. NBC_01304]
MRYAVLGTGQVGCTLGSKLIELGHEVTMGARQKDHEGALDWVARSGPRASCGTFADAAAFGEVAFLAVEGRFALDALQDAGEGNLAGKVLVDVTNPIVVDRRGLHISPVESDSAGQQVQRAFPQARVVKALNTVNHLIMVDPALVPGEHQLFVCGDDTAAKEQVTALLGEFGWPPHRVLDLGGIRHARDTEMMMRVWLSLMERFGHAEFNWEVRRAR